MKMRTQLTIENTMLLLRGLFRVLSRSFRPTHESGSLRAMLLRDNALINNVGMLVDRTGSDFVETDKDTQNEAPSSHPFDYFDCEFLW